MLDVHTHCLLPEHWGREWTDHWQPTTGVPWPRTDPEQYDAAMAEAGVNVALVCGIRASALGVKTPPEFVAQFCERTSTPTVGLAALDLLDPDLGEQLERSIDLGLKGVKLYPAMAGFDASDERYDRFYSRASDAGLVLLWHMGATVTPAGHLKASQPMLLDEVARRHPNLRQIIAHVGSPWHRDAIAVMRKNRNVWADISGVWQRPTEGRAILKMAEEFSVGEKLLFGSDFPLHTPAEVRAGIEALGMDGEVDVSLIETILRGPQPEALRLNI